MVNLRAALSFSFLDRYAGLLVAVGSSILLARLLTPAEIGVWSVTIMLLSYASTVRDLGTGQYLVQKRDITPEHIRAIWFVQLAIGLLLAVLVAVAAGPVARFYAEPRMHVMMLIVAINYALNPFGSLTYAWLVREMRFGLLAAIRFASTLVGTLISLVLAWQGHGPISLAIGSLSTTAISSGLFLFFRPSSFPWLPGLRGIRQVISFGSATTASLVAQSAAASTPELLLGKLQSLSAAGFYSRSNGLVTMFNRLIVDAVSGVALSWFAQHAREDISMAEPFLKATAYVSALGWSFCLAIVFLAQPVILTLYGDQWSESVDLARLLAVATAFNAPAALCWSALLARGAAGQVFRATMICSVQTVALVIVGAVFGLQQLGIAMIAVAAIGAAVWLWICHQELGFQWSDLWAVLSRSMLVAAGSGIVPAVVFIVYGAYPEQRLYPLAIGLSGSVLGFIGAVYAINHPLRAELARLRWPGAPR